MPKTTFSVEEKYEYLEGFGNYHQSEAVKGANPTGANTPQRPPLGLNTERISGTSFTAPRAENLQTWLYRIVPSLSHRDFSLHDISEAQRSDEQLHYTPNAFRWLAFDIEPGLDFVSSQKLLAKSGDPSTKTGHAYFTYSATKDMDPRTAFFSSDGDFLIVPQAGTLDIQTELGHMLVRQSEIAVIPRGIRYRITLPSGPARGYICELYQGHFQLPELGPIGSCSLANIRDFQIPTACFDGRVEDGIAKSTNRAAEWTIVTRFGSKIFSCTQNHTPFDIVAWHGNYYPYKYDLGRFSVIGSVLYDHPDPSIFTVLTAPSHRLPGTAVVDFAIFPPRWGVMENTYWLPYFHRNCMSEFAGAIIRDQDPDSPWNSGNDFQPFGALLNNSMVPHGMDKQRHEAARSRSTEPAKIDNEPFMLFMFEAEAMMAVTSWGMKMGGRALPADSGDKAQSKL